MKGRGLDLVPLYLIISIANALHQNSTLLPNQNTAECGPDSQNVRGIKVQWGTPVESGNYTYYYSEPLCLSEKKTYLLRKCINGKWDEEPTCDSVQTEDSVRCLDGLQYIASADTCYKISENKSAYGAFQCPYYDFFIKSIHLEEVILTSDHKVLWTNYLREDISNGIGDFYNNDHTLDYSNPPDDQTLIPISTDKKCIGAKNEDENIVNSIENCTEPLYKNICAYDKLDLQNTGVCAYFIHKECYTSTLRQINPGQSIKCICPTRNCSRPAEYFAGTAGSKLNLVLSKDGFLQWESPPRNVTNTYWSIRNLQVTLGAHFIWSSSYGWTTTNDEPQTIMCEIDLDLGPKPEIQLTYDSDMEKFTVKYLNEKRIYTAKLSVAMYDEFSVLCYIDLNTNFKKLLYQGPLNIDFTLFVERTGNYWCEAFDVVDMSPIKSNRLVVTKDNMFVLTVILPNVLLIKMESLREWQNVKDLISKYHPVANTRIVNRLEIHNDSNALYSVRVTTPFSSDQRYSSEFLRFQNFIKQEQKQWSGPAIQGIASTRFCSDLKVHLKGFELFWHAASVDEESVSNHCLDKNTQPMKIKCYLEYYKGAIFSSLPDCYFIQNTRVSHVTDMLTDLHDDLETLDPTEAIILLINITTRYEEFVPYDVHWVANILEKLKETMLPVKYIQEVVSNVMNVYAYGLQESQITYNATDRILDQLDHAIKQIIPEESEEIIVFDNIVTLLINLNTSSYSGFAFTNESVMLPSDWTVSDILNLNNLQMAVFIKGTPENSKHGIASITLFKLATLFNEKWDEINYKVNQLVSGVLLPQLKNKQILIIHKVKNQDIEVKCSYWLYGIDKYGSWRTETDYTSVDHKHFQICGYIHTTHFGQLIMTSDTISATSRLVLEILTGIECLLSFLGLCVVFFTAWLNKQWRSQKEKTLHYCLVSLVQTIMLFLTNSKLDDWSCILVGALLQFTVLSQFCWLVMIGWSQYNRIVRVYTGIIIPMWKTLVFTYVVPLIIVTLVVSVDRLTFLENNMNICYPTGTTLIISLIIPAGCVMLFNGFIFVRILWELKKPAENAQTQSKKAKRQDAITKFKQIAIMVFSMGLTWWFGIIASAFNSIFFLFLFTITTCLQGFVIFLFLIVFDKFVRGIYYVRSIDN